MKKIFALLLCVTWCGFVAAQITTVDTTKWQHRVFAMLDKEQYHQASQLLDTVLTYDGHSVMARFYRSFCRAAEGNMPAALRDIDTAIYESRQIPQWQARCLMLKAELYRPSDVKKAFKFLDKAIKVAPGDEKFDYRLQKGDWLFDINNLKQAQKIYAMVYAAQGSTPAQEARAAIGMASVVCRREASVAKPDTANLRAVINIMREVNAKQPTARAYRILSSAYMLLGDTCKVLQNSYYYDAHANSRLYDFIDADNSAFLTLAKDHADLALNVLEKVDNEKIAYPYFMRAKVLMLYKQDYARALENYTKAITYATSEYGYLLCERAICYNELKQHQKAISDLMVAIKNDSSIRMMAENLMGYTLYQHLEQPDQALQHYRTCLQADSSFAAAHVGIARCYIALGDSVQGLDYMDSVTRRFPGSLLLWSDYGAICLHVDDYRRFVYTADSTFALMQKMQAQGVEFTKSFEGMINNNMGFALMRLGEMERCEPYIMKALKLQPEVMSVRDTYGEFLYRKQRYTKAEVVLTSIIVEAEATDKVKEVENSYYYRGLTRIALGHTAEGIADIRRAAAFESTDAQAYLKTHGAEQNGDK